MTGTDRASGHRLRSLPYRRRRAMALPAHAQQPSRGADRRGAQQLPLRLHVEMLEREAGRDRGDPMPEEKRGRLVRRLPCRRLRDQAAGRTPAAAPLPAAPPRRLLPHPPRAPAPRRRAEAGRASRGDRNTREACGAESRATETRGRSKTGRCRGARRARTGCRASAARCRAPGAETGRCRRRGSCACFCTVDYPDALQRRADRRRPRDQMPVRQSAGVVAELQGSDREGTSELRSTS